MPDGIYGGDQALMAKVVTELELYLYLYILYIKLNKEKIKILHSKMCSISKYSYRKVLSDK